MRLNGTMSLQLLLAGAAVLGMGEPNVAGQEMPVDAGLPTAIDAGMPGNASIPHSLSPANDAAPLADSAPARDAQVAAPPTPVSDPAPEAMVGNARLVAVLPNKSRAPTLIGKSGEFYEPSSDLQWQRVGAGGVSTDVQSIFKTDGEALFAVGSRAPLFRRASGLWAAFPLGNRGRAAVSPGRLPVISVGRHIYQLSGSSWRRIASARGGIRALFAAKPNRVYVVTTQNQLFVGGSRSWQRVPITLPVGDQIRSLVGLPGKAPLALTDQNHLYALQPKGAKLVTTGPELRGLQIHAMGVAGGRLLLAGRVGASRDGKTVLAEVGKSKIQTLTPLWPLEPDDRFALIYQDHKNRLLVGSHQGQLRVQEKDGQWRNGELRLAPPSPPEDFKHSAPARSR